jgi:putative two-component system response regulator
MENLVEILQKKYLDVVGADYTDALTGVYTYGMFRLLFEEEMELAKNNNTPLTLALIDVDLMRIINRKDGFLEGDILLKKAANIISEYVRKHDHTARFNEDIFAIILKNARPYSIRPAVERIKKGVEEAFNNSIALSIGIASYPEDAGNSADLIEYSMEAMEQSKVQGSNRVHIYVREDEDILFEHPKILIVDDDDKNLKLLEANLTPRGYQIIRASNGEEALSLIKRIDIDLVLLDILMEGIDGYEVCRKIKSADATRFIPIILITSDHRKESKVTGIDAGADDFLTKPIDMEELFARVRSLVKVRLLNKDFTNIESVLFSLVNAIEAKDSYTQGHTERVAHLSTELGKRMDLSKREIAALRLGGILHDIGKIGVSGDILNKPGPLDNEEWHAMQSHTEIGYKICLPLTKSLGMALDIIRHHHEKLDGSSYPDGLKSNQISPVTKIMTIVDIFDALITDRPYRKAMSQTNALALMDDETVQGKLDPEIMSHLKAMLGDSTGKAFRKDDTDRPDIPTILVVEDDELNLKLVRTLLQLEHYRVLEAKNAEAGILIARENKPDLILMDIQLPGMNGIEASRIIKEDNKLSKIPLLAISSYAMKKDIDSAMEAGCEGYITKPIDTKSFMAYINSSLTGGPSS